MDKSVRLEPLLMPRVTEPLVADASRESQSFGDAAQLLHRGREQFE